MRTRNDWEAEIDFVATSMGANLSTSAVAEWKLWRDIIVTIAMLIEGIVTMFKKDIDKHLLNEQHGSLNWYRSISKAFQLGDALMVTNGIVAYSPVIPANQIIKQVSVREVADDTLLIKVAKLQGTDLIKLQPGELIEFNTYLLNRKLPGTKLNVQSLDADVLYIEGAFYYDTLYPSGVVLNNVMAKLEEFKNNFAFDSILYRSSITEVIMSAEGMVGTGPLDLLINNDYSIVDFLELQSGYFNIDVNITINMIPSI
jgi:hypothetical protein